MTKDEALKMALKFVEDTECGTADLEAHIKEALAQLEQKPVGWRTAAIRLGEDLCSVGPFGYYDMTAEQWLDWALSVVTVHAPPPQRTWVGLTQTQVKLLWEGVPEEAIKSGDSVNWIFYMHINEALKEKNT